MFRVAPALTLLLAAPSARAEIAPPEPGHASAQAEVEAARGAPIERVVIAGNRRVPSDVLAEHLTSTRPGLPFSPEGLSRDVRSLWGSGLVEDVEVDLQTGSSGVSIRILVRERPTVKTIEILGNHGIDEDDLREVIADQLKRGEVPSQTAVRAAAEKIRAKYLEEGYCLAEVRPEVVPAKGGQSIVRLVVREGEKPTVRRINFVGNVGVPADELEEVMMTGKGGFWSSLGLGLGLGGPFRQDVLERDVLVMSGLYYDKGYLGVSVGTPRVMITPDREGIEISIPIDEGPRFKLRSIRVEERDADGKEVEPLGGRRHLREMVHAKAGSFFNRAALIKDIGAIQTMYRDAGYAHVDVPPGTELDPEKHEVDLHITIKRGPVVRFGRIEIHGNTKTRDKVIRRELVIAEEGLYSETGLARSRQRVEALGFFGRVDVTTREGESPDRLDVILDITEKPTGTFQIGAGFSSLESFLFTSQIQQANLFGTGRSLSLNAQLSGVRQTVDFRFFEPHLYDSKASLTVSLYDQVRAYDQFTQASKGGSMTVGYPIAGRLFGSLTYTLQHDRAETAGGSSALAGTSSAVSTAFPRLPLANLSSDGRTSSLRATLTYDTRNNQLFPTSGMFLQGSVEAATSLLGSENELYRWRGTARFYKPLTDDHSVVLRFNAEAGLVTSPSPRGVPLFARFFLGGMPDVRGFPLRSLGPRLPLGSSLDPNASLIPNGANVGGNLMYYQNLELEFPILKAMNVRGVVFTDLGNVWNTEGQYCRAAPSRGAAALDPCFSLAHLAAVRASWGFGVRWLSPMGPLRFEWGFPFKRMPYEKPRLFEFTVGGAF